MGRQGAPLKPLVSSGESEGGGRKKRRQQVDLKKLIFLEMRKQDNSTKAGLGSRAERP